MSRPVAFILTLAIGLLVALQPPANADLAKHVGDLGAALVSLLIAAAIIAVLLLVFGQPARLSGITGIRPEHVLGGLAGAFVVYIGLAAVRPLGVGAVIALLVGAQLVGSIVVDRFGWFGVQQVGLSAARLAGVGLVIAGTLLITRA
jgi:bacterial/archaeal transporter family-2 protein